MKQIQSAVPGQQLRRAFSLTGGLDVRLDETVVPVRLVGSPYADDPAARDAVMPTIHLMVATARGAGQYSGVSFGCDPSFVLLVRYLRILNISTAARFRLNYMNAGEAATATQQSSYKQFGTQAYGGYVAPRVGCYSRELSHTSMLGTQIDYAYFAASQHIRWEIDGGWAVYGEGSREDVTPGAELVVWCETANQGFNVTVGGLLYPART